MSAQDNGGPAFPELALATSSDGRLLTHASGGMTMRDYFAAKAMTTLLDLCLRDAREPELSYPEHIAAVSYGMADAMLQERAK